LSERVIMKLVLTKCGESMQTVVSFLRIRCGGGLGIALMNVNSDGVDHTICSKRLYYS
jgi:hypothetical protein